VKASTMDSIRRAHAVTWDAIGKSEWPIRCLRKCAEPIGLLEQKNGVEALCPECAFRSPPIPYEWYKMSIRAAIHQLLETSPHVPEEQARSWINNTKYTHPTYWLAQQIERQVAVQTLQGLLTCLVRPESQPAASVLCVGCNNADEMTTLPFRWDPERSLGVDVAAGALTVAQTRIPGLRCAEASAEDFHPQTVDQFGRAVSDVYGSFDICLALRVFPVNNLRLWAALSLIRDALRPGGWVVISIPKKTAFISGNIHPGIWSSKSKCFTEERPKRQVEGLAAELTSGSEMYQRVSVHYGTREDSEYYVCAQRR
jgi:SAM-dependent methyltransferase